MKHIVVNVSYDAISANKNQDVSAWEGCSGAFNFLLNYTWAEVDNNGGTPRLCVPDLSYKTFEVLSGKYAYNSSYTSDNRTTIKKDTAVVITGPTKNSNTSTATGSSTTYAVLYTDGSVYLYNIYHEYNSNSSTTSETYTYKKLK